MLNEIKTMLADSNDFRLVEKDRYNKLVFTFKPKDKDLEIKITMSNDINYYNQKFMVQSSVYATVRYLGDTNEELYYSETIRNDDKDFFVSLWDEAIGIHMHIKQCNRKALFDELQK